MKHKETENILKLTELLRIVVINGKTSCRMPVTTDAPQDLYWGLYSCMFSLTTQGMGQITLSEPFKGTSAGWRNGPTRVSWSSAKKSAKSYTGGNNCVHQYRLGDWPAAKQPCREQQQAMSHHMPLQQRSPTVSWSTLERALPASWGRGFFHSAQSSWDTTQVLSPVLDSPVQHRNGRTRVNPTKGHKGD